MTTNFIVNNYQENALGVRGNSWLLVTEQSQERIEQFSVSESQENIIEPWIHRLRIAFLRFITIG